MIPTAFYFAPLDAPGGLLNWLFGGGIGSNLGASIVIVGLGGWKLYKAWRAHRAAVAHLLTRVEALHESHEQLHAKLDGLKSRPPIPVAAVIPVRRARPPDPEETP